MQTHTNTSSSFENKQKPLEAAERRNELRDYFDLAWQIFLRLEEDGTLDKLNLTASPVNPTVKPEKVPDQNQPTSSTP